MSICNLYILPYMITFDRLSKIIPVTNHYKYEICVSIRILFESTIASFDNFMLKSAGHV